MKGGLVMYLVRRLVIGAGIGLALAGGLLVLARDALAAGRMVDPGWSLLLAGALVGVGWGLTLRPASGGLPAMLVGGLILGLAGWILLPLNVYPALRGEGAFWEVAEIAPVFPELIFLLIHGGVGGLLYGLGSRWVAAVWPLEPSADPPAITQRVVILGGGYAGVAAAQALERELANHPAVSIVLISQNNYLLHTPMLSEVAASAVNPQNISPPLRSFFRQVQVVQGTVERVDLAERKVYLAPDRRSLRREFPFDHLVLTVGSVPNFFGQADIARKAFTFKSLEDAMVLRNQVIDLVERADIEPDPEKRRRMLTFVVAGGGFAGVELIGGLNDFARGILPFYPNIALDELRLVLVHSRERILPELSESLAQYAQEKLERRGVEFRLGQRVKGVRPGVVVLEDGEIPAETLIWTAGNRPSPVLETLGLPLTERGQITVTPELAVPGVEGVWAAGDCALVPDLVSGGYAPPTAQHAVREGKVLGYNIAAQIRGKSLKPFRYKMLGSLAALGYQLAVAEIGRHRFSGFVAWVMWRTIYLSKLPTLEKRIRVLLDWVLDIFFPADIVQTSEVSRSAPAIHLPESPILARDPEKR